MKYEKIDGTIYKVVTTKTVVDLKALKAEVADLKAMEEPSDEELIEAGRMMHPFYMDRQDKINFFETKITGIEKDIKPVEK